ncbi:MAG: tetratricopeptide repeat protein [Bacteroidota bacterium]|nr:tetratricopeptide repeat protein [Bacteroidota bacterium]
MMKSVTRFFVFAIFLIQGNVFAQSAADSLRRELRNPSATDSLKAHLYNKIAFEFLRENSDSCAFYLREGYTFSSKKKFQKELSRICFYFGKMFYYDGQIDSSRFWYQRSLELDIQLKDARAMIDDCIHISKTYSNQGNVDKSLFYLLKGIGIARQTSKKDQEAECLFTIAVMYDRQDQPLKAIDYCKSALIIQKQLNDSAAMAFSLHRMGLAYEGLENHDEALKHLEESLEIRKRLGLTGYMGASLNGIGLVYMEKKEYQKALTRFYDAHKYWKESNDKEGVVIATGNLGELYKRMGDEENALKYLLQSYELAQEIHSLVFQKGSSHAIAEIYYKKGNYKQAYDYFKNFSDIRDTLFNEENSNQLIQIQSKYEAEQKEQQIQLLTKEKLLQRSEISQKKILLNAVMIGGVLLLLLLFMIYNRYRLKQKANSKLQDAYNQIELKNETLLGVYNVLEHNRDEIATKNKEITDSIKYAKRLQTAILPSDEYIRETFPDSFVFYQPKDIVSGDFYWFERWGGKSLFAAVDCTGHGVPGAFMSIVGFNLLNQAVNEHGLNKPNLLLNALNKGITKTLKQTEEDSIIKDGMDISLCSIDRETMKLEYSGAYNPLWIIRDHQLTELTADKHPIGVFWGNELKPFTLKEFDLKKGDRVYLFTDGMADQFGGSKGKKFKYSQMKKLLISLYDYDMEAQKNIIIEEFNTWKGNLEQVDDILIMGICI